MTRRLFILFLLISSMGVYAQPPYSGTIFIDGDIITSSDPSAVESVNYNTQKDVTMFDRRVSNWVTVNAYHFNVVWDDGLTSIAQVNPEFGSVAVAEAEAEKYAFLIGQLPACLRRDVNEIWIHKGTEPFGGGNNSILIHTGQSTLYEKDGIIEETLVHEASHTSLDADHASSTGWVNAQNLDNTFISNYARDNPVREDIAESFLTWLAVRFRKDNISASDFGKITSAIPNRLAYFDAMDCNLYPFSDHAVYAELHKNEGLKIAPNFELGLLRISDQSVSKEDVRVYNLLGQDFTSYTSLSGNELNVNGLPIGFYLVNVKTMTQKIYKP